MMAKQSQPQQVQATTRTLMQSAKIAIADVFDAITELVTNADDAYQRAGGSGRIEIEVERKRGDSRGLLRIRDFGSGMSRADMEKKLSRMGGRESGLEAGLRVRGTNSRGAKDVAALGDVAFESITRDGKYQSFNLDTYFEWTAAGPEPATQEIREKLGLPTGTGTVVVIHLNKETAVPQHESLRDKICRLVSLHDILANGNRKVLLRDLNQKRTDELRAPKIDGKERVSETVSIPGYPGKEAKIRLCRSPAALERGDPRFRLGGVVVKSRHAIHEATLFDPSLETDVYAQHYFGRLTCEGIEDLWNEYDDRFARKEAPSQDNPTVILDPSRKTGLTRDHPFVKALFGEALKRLRPLIEEDRRRAESERATVENRKTRARLNELERAASQFLKDHLAENSLADGSERRESIGAAKRRGYSLQPPFSQLIMGESAHFTFNLIQEAYPQYPVGAAVVIDCLSKDIATDTRVCPLEQHPMQQGVLRARFKVSGVSPTPATGVRVVLDEIVAESAVEVLASRMDRYKWVKTLCFERERYAAQSGTKGKKVCLLAPLAPVERPTEVQLSCSTKGFVLPAPVLLRPEPELGVAIAEFRVRMPSGEQRGILEASLGALKATAEIRTLPESGQPLKIKIEDIDLGNQRYRLHNGLLQIAARHSSLKRYLGTKEDGFPGQDNERFRVLIAEIVAEAICADIISRNAEERPEEYKNADWDQYYSEYSEYMTKFLPIAHKTQVPTI
jgi:hypothetical protein